MFSVAITGLKVALELKGGADIRARLPQGNICGVIQRVIRLAAAIKSNDEPIKYLWNRMQAPEPHNRPQTPRCYPDGYTMFTPRQPPEGCFCVLAHTYARVCTRALDIAVAAGGAPRILSDRIPRRGGVVVLLTSLCLTLLTLLTLLTSTCSFSRICMRLLDDFHPLGYGQFFSAASSEVSKQAGRVLLDAEGELIIPG